MWDKDFKVTQTITLGDGKMTATMKVGMGDGPHTCSLDCFLIVYPSVPVYLNPLGTQVVAPALHSDDHILHCGGSGSPSRDVMIWPTDQMIQ